MTFELNRHAREPYDLYLETNPPVVEWEASFDNGETWHAGTSLAATEPGWYRWLIAGARAEKGTAVAQLTVGPHQPLVRTIANPDIVVRQVEPIEVT